MSPPVHWTRGRFRQVQHVRPNSGHTKRGPTNQTRKALLTQTGMCNSHGACLKAQ